VAGKLQGFLDNLIHLVGRKCEVARVFHLVVKIVVNLVDVTVQRGRQIIALDDLPDPCLTYLSRFSLR